MAEYTHRDVHLGYMNRPEHLWEDVTILVETHGVQIYPKDKPGSFVVIPWHLIRAASIFPTKQSDEVNDKS